MSFASATRVTGGPGSWTAELADGWDIAGVTNGGYLMAMAARAMGAEAGGRNLASVTASFVNPARPGPVEIEVEELKTGRSLSTLRAAMSRDGRPLVFVTGVFAEARRGIGDVDLVRASPPALPTPDDCVPATPPADGSPFPPPFTGKVELRLHPDDAGAVLGVKTGVPEMRGWFRLRDGEPLDPYAVLLACDALPPAIFNTDLNVGWTPTVDMAVQVRNPNPEGWMACRFSTSFITGGMLEEDGQIWDESGNLVALSRQLALVPR